MGFVRGLRMSRFCCLLLVLLSANCVASDTVEPIDGRALIAAALEHWRGQSSYSEMSMTIHRPDWQRGFTMRSWTQGDKLSLVRILEPKRDAGNGTLLKGKNMWTYSPKVRRTIKIPSSMMAQSWMGSDFSNRDISRSTELIDDYDHRLLEQNAENGHQVYTVESVPHEDAAVVWGKEILRIRDDYIMLEHQFWDQDGELVKTMRALKVETMDGRAVASHIRMAKTNKSDEWTEMKIQSTDFDIDIPDNMFTLSNLANPRR